MEYKNVTLRLPEALVRKFRVYAAKRSESMTALVAEMMSNAVEEDADSEARKRRAIERMRNAPDLGTAGKITWTRDELYERS